MNRNRTVALACALALSVTVAACGDDDDTTTAAIPAATSSTTSVPEVADGAVDVVAADYSFEDLPATIAKGSRITLTNSSEGEVHELVAFRLPDDEQRTAAELVDLPEAELQALFGGPPTMVLVAPPASDGFPVFGDGTVTVPGRYLAFCAIPTGADPAEYLAAAEASAGPPEVDGGPPHMHAGMFAEFTVE